MSSQPAISEANVKCGSCSKHVPEADLSSCPVCDAKFCGDSSQCDCDRMKELFET